MKYEIDIFHYFNIYRKEWKKMVSLTVAVMAVTILMQWMQPVTYSSTLIALSSKEGGQVGSGISKIFGLSVSSSDDIVFSMLKSRRMRKDINEHFDLRNKPRFWWALDTYVVTGGFAVEVKAPDPEMTEKITNFAVKNLDKINKELVVSTEVPMVKVLDPAVRGAPIGRNTSKKVVASGLLVFFIYTLFIFFREYFSNLKKLKK